MMRDDNNNPFILEELVVPQGSISTKTPPKFGHKAARKKPVEKFFMVTEAQAHRLVGVSVVVTVFHCLMLKELDARCSSFVLKPDAMEHLGIDRFAQKRALRALAKRGLISMERRDGPRKPFTVTVLGSRITTWRRAK